MHLGIIRERNKPSNKRFAAGGERMEEAVSLSANPTLAVQTGSNHRTIMKIWLITFNNDGTTGDSIAFFPFSNFGDEVQQNGLPDDTSAHSISRCKIIP